MMNEIREHGATQSHRVMNGDGLMSKIEGAQKMTEALGQAVAELAGSLNPVLVPDRNEAGRESDKAPKPAMPSPAVDQVDTLLIRLASLRGTVLQLTNRLTL